MKNKRWHNIALGLAFALPVIGVYVGKKLLSKRTKNVTEIVPEVTRIRVPITSLIGINAADEVPESENGRIVLPDGSETVETQEQESSSEITNVQYIASIERGKFHIPNCRWAQNIKVDNRVLIEDRASALERGFVPCNTCNP